LMHGVTMKFTVNMFVFYSEFLASYPIP